MTTLPSTPLAVSFVSLAQIVIRWVFRLTAELCDAVAGGLIRTNHGDGVLVNSLELGVILGLALEIHLSEHVQCRLLALRAETGVALGLDRSGQLPAALATLESESLAIVASSDDLIFRAPQQALEGKHLGGNGDNGTRGLIGSGGVDNSNAAVMSSKGKAVTARGESDGVNPSGRVVQELSANSVEGKSLAPDAGGGSGINTLDEAGEDSSVGVGGTGGEEDGVGVPGDAGDGAANGLLDVLGHPPVVLLFEVADGDDTVTGTDGELGLRRRPADESRGPVNSKQDQSGLVSGRGGLPDKGITI